MKVIDEHGFIRDIYYEEDCRYYHVHEGWSAGKWRRLLKTEISEEEYRTAARWKDDTDEFIERYDTENEYKNGAVNKWFKREWGQDELVRIQEKARAYKKLKQEVEHDIQVALLRGSELPFYSSDDATEIKMRFLKKKLCDDGEAEEMRYNEVFTYNGMTYTHTKMSVDGRGKPYYTAEDSNGKKATFDEKQYRNRVTAMWYKDEKYLRKNGRETWLLDHPDFLTDDLKKAVRRIQCLEDAEKFEEAKEEKKRASEELGIDINTMNELVGR